MINIIKIKEISSSYPEEIEGTNEWYAAKEPGNEFCDLYEAQMIYNKNKYFIGMNYHLIHFPDGKVHSPFQLKENIYVDKPVWNDGIFYFLLVDFSSQLIKITEYNPINSGIQVVTELSLTEV